MAPMITSLHLLTEFQVAACPENLASIGMNDDGVPHLEALANTNKIMRGAEGFSSLLTLAQRRAAGWCPPRAPKLHTDFEGFDLERLDSVALKKCCTACKDEPRCQCFTFSRLTNKCWLKTKEASKTSQ